MSAANEDVVRRQLECYLAGDRAGSQALVDPDFTFTSPQDDHIDRDTFYERCFPTASRVSSQELRLISSAGDDVVIMYEYVLAESGARFRNTEVITVRDGLIVEVQVFFGGRY